MSGQQHEARSPVPAARAEDAVPHGDRSAPDGSGLDGDATPDGAGTAPAGTSTPTWAPAPDGGEVATLRRELQRLRWEVDSLRERVQHLDGELGFAMLNAGRLRGRLDREVAAREALEGLLAGGDAARPAVVALPDQASSSRSRSAAWRSGTRSFLTEVDT